MTEHYPEMSTREAIQKILRGYGPKLETYDKETGSELDFSYSDIKVTHDIERWLAEKLTYRADLSKDYDMYVKETGDYHWLPSMTGWVEQLKFDEGRQCPRGIYGEGEPITVNSYNSECLLSNVIQFVYWTDDWGDVFVILQIHLYGDVRGNYSFPMVFECDDETAIFDYGKATINCIDCEAYWDTDDGVHWYSNGNACDKDGLETYERVNLKPDYVTIDKKQLSFDFVTDCEPFQPSIPNTRKLYVVDNKGYCPRCGHELRACYY
jgi:hypothetical protein